MFKLKNIFKTPAAKRRDIAALKASHAREDLIRCLEGRANVNGSILRNTTGSEAVHASNRLDNRNLCTVITALKSGQEYELRDGQVHVRVAGQTYMTSTY